MGGKRHRIKQVQVQEKIIHKKRRQYFIGRGAEVHYSPPLWTKCPSYLSVSAGQKCALKIHLTSSCSDSTGPIWTFPPAASLIPDRRSPQVAGCDTLWLHLLQGLMGVEESPMLLRRWACPLTAARGSPVPCHQNHHWEDQLNEIKLLKNRHTMIVFSWLYFPSSWSESMNPCSDVRLFFFS